MAEQDDLMEQRFHDPMAVTICPCKTVEREGRKQLILDSSCPIHGHMVPSPLRPR